MADKQFVYVLISASYETDEPVPSSYLTKAIGDVLARTEQVDRITAYSMGYFINPLNAGLKHQWFLMSHEEKEEFAESYPDLATAIALMCDGGDDGSKGLAAVEDNSGKTDA